MSIWETTSFLLSVAVISASGVMAPGPLTAAVISTGTRSRHAGAQAALGHGIIELPLVILIVAGMDKLLASDTFQIIVGVTGGALMLVMAWSMTTTFKYTNPADQPETKKNPRTGALTTGIILTAGNPFFLLWWATVGLALATQARQLGIWAFALFALTHWLCDLIWLEMLSWASFKGATILGPKNYQRITMLCAAALAIFATKFIFVATTNLWTTIT